MGNHQSVTISKDNNADFFKCNNHYDNDLLQQVGHFKLHKEYLPYIGPQYNEFRILLIGESHYLPRNDKGEPLYNEEQFACWYEKKTMEILREDIDHANWFNTRHVVNNFLEHHRSRAYSIFSKPTKVFCEVTKEQWGVNINDSDAFRCFAFCNYFQRPEFSYGKSISVSDEDCRKSREIIQKVIDILQPQKIIFISKKAFEYFDSTDSRIQYVNHPTSSSWNNKNGSEKFQKIITEYLNENSINDYKSCFEQLNDKKIALLDKVFFDIQQHIGNKCEISTDFKSEIKRFYGSDDEICPSMDCLFEKNGMTFSLRFEVCWFLYFGVCAWNTEKSKVQESIAKIHFGRDVINPFEAINRHIGMFYWWEYLPNVDEAINFRYIGQGVASLFDEKCYESFRESIFKQVDDFFENLFKKNTNIERKI